MDRDFLKKAITEQYKALNEQMETLLRHEKKIPQIELDITLNNLREIYEYLHALNKINQFLPGNGTPEKPAPILEKQPPPVKEDTSVKEETPVEAKTEPVRPVEPIAPPPVVVEKKPKQAEPEVKEPAIVVKAAVRAETLTETLAETEKKAHFELFEEGPKTIADKLKSKDEVRIADKVGKQVTTLKNAIGLNEKFLFINELFRGKLTDYNKAIKQLDEMPDGATCHEEFKMLTQQYEWDTQSDTYLKLADFVQKKHQTA